MDYQKSKKKKRTVLLVSTLVAANIIIVGLLIGDPAVMGNLVIIAAFLVAIPYFLFKYSRYAWVKSLEDEFPNFIRDLADSVRSMPLPQALGVVCRSNYGNLTPEIQSMHNRLTWGTPFIRALEIFKKEARESKLISESLDILAQSYSSGGSMVSTLESISRDLLMLKEANEEKNSVLQQHIIIMYAIFFMFTGIAILIIQVMVPMISSQAGFEVSDSPFGGGGGMVFTNPCASSQSIPFPCSLFEIIASMFDVPFEKIGAYYLALFFSSVMMQGLFIGLITGELSENSATAGIKHSLIMLITTIMLFMFMSRAGLIPI
jgi:flagellar protein FlaJ